MGWQRDDPGSDFRGGGFLALELLVAFAEDDPEEFGALMGKKRGTRSEFEYPFGAAGVNVTFTLIGALIEGNCFIFMENELNCIFFNPVQRFWS